MNTFFYRTPPVAEGSKMGFIEKVSRWHYYERAYLLYSCYIFLSASPSKRLRFVTSDGINSALLKEVVFEHSHKK